MDVAGIIVWGFVVETVQAAPFARNESACISRRCSPRRRDVGCVFCRLEVLSYETRVASIVSPQRQHWWKGCGCEDRCEDDGRVCRSSSRKDSGADAPAYLVAQRLKGVSCYEKRPWFV